MKRLSVFRAIIFVGVFAVNSPYVAADDWGGTFSIVAYDSLTGELGVAVQSKAFTVGPAVAWAEANVGAIATQASTNESFGPNGLELLRSGLSAEEVLGRLVLCHRRHVSRRGPRSSRTGRLFGAERRTYRRYFGRGLFQARHDRQGCGGRRTSQSARS